MSGISATFLQIENIDENVLSQDNIFIPGQQSLDTYNINVNKLGLPKTEIHKEFQEDNFIHYNVKMSTETIKEPIYIYEDGYEEYNKGYQRIEKFNVWLNYKDNLLIIFAPKKISQLFIQRLTKANYLKVNKKEFDFSKIQELKNMDNAWGFWKDSKGIVRRIANFGKGLTEEITDYSTITTFYIDYEHDSGLLQLILSKEGSIATKNNIHQRDIYLIYKEISKVLC